MPNTFKTDKNEVDKSKKKKRSKSGGKAKVKSPKKIKRTAPKKDRKGLRIGIGIILMVFAIYTTISMVSYLINIFKYNTTLNTITWDYLIHGNSKNVMGNIGEAIADLFVKQWFGIGSFLLMFMIFHYGFYFAVKRKIIRKHFIITPIVFIVVWLSIVLAIAIPNDPYNILGGNLGMYIYSKAYPLTGKMGAIIILAVLFLIFIGIRYGLNLLKVFHKSEEDTSKDKAIDKKLKEDNYEIKEDPDEIAVLPVTDTFDKETEDNNDIEDIKIVDDKKQKYEPRGHVRFFNLGKRSKKQEATEEDNNDEESIINTTTSDDDIEISQENDEIVSVHEEKKVQSVSEKIDDTLSVERHVEESFEGKEILDHYTIDTEYDPTLDLPDYKMPSVDLLLNYEKNNVEISNAEIEKNRQKITNTLRTYSIEIESIKATVGPTVTLYEIVPAPGVRLAKIKNLEDDIAMSLAAIGIRIIAPIPGKGTVGIEVPNENPQIVSLRSVLSSKKFVESTFELPIALGKTITNESFVTDLTKMPHLLVAGATGQGKSVGLNAIIASLLYKKHPSQLKFVLIDPKKVEFSLYERIENHYLAKLPESEEAIITDTKLVVNTLNSLLIEMDTRYSLLKMSGQRNIKQYNAKFIDRQLNPELGHRFLPYIVVIIDEFADLIMTAGKEVERPLTRLAQLARATGIHLVIATQRPSVNIITGTIKANFPARLAFRVVQKTDSRTILDASGADQLIGRGDMLLSTGSTELLRMQCAFIDTEEVMALTEYIGSQRGYGSALLLPEYVGESAENALSDNVADRDELFDPVARMIVQTQVGSTSSIQRKFNLGYNRAGRIMDQLEAAGIVGPQQGSKPREVYVQSEAELDKILYPEE